MARRPPHVELFTDAAGKWRWRLVGANGEIMATSQAYANRPNARRGADRANPTAEIRT